MTDSVSCL